jgi:hypothetical protein
VAVAFTIRVVEWPGGNLQGGGLEKPSLLDVKSWIDGNGGVPIFTIPRLAQAPVCKERFQCDQDSMHGAIAMGLPAQTTWNVLTTGLYRHLCFLDGFAISGKLLTEWPAVGQL